MDDLDPSVTSDGSVHSDVKDYYGKVLAATSDLKSTACCTRINKSGLSERLRDALAKIHPEVTNKYYGCGLVFPEAVERCYVLDLGSGSGRDCFVLSRLVGQAGYVTGVDMTKEQIEVARKYIDYHMTEFGYASPNVAFIEGLIEDILDLGIKRDSMDVIISNCVINLCPNKRKVFEGAFAALKVGGEMYFSDIYADRPVSQEARSNKILHGECISGALEWKDLMSIALEVGFAPPVLVDASPVTVPDDPELNSLLGETQFCSATYRLFKSNHGNRTESPMNEEVTYKGTITDHPNKIKFSHSIELETGTALVLPSSVSQLLKETRLGSHFTFTPTSGLTSSYVDLSSYTEISPFQTSNSSSCCAKKESCCGSSTKTCC